MLVHDYLRRSAERDPDRLLAVDAQGPLSYGAAAASSDRMARVLMESGVRPGERVLIALENSRDWIAAYFGTLKAGAVAVPLPQGPKSDRLEPALADCTPTVCITDVPTAEALAEPLRRRAMRTVLVHVPSGSALPATLASAGFDSLSAAVTAVPEGTVEARAIDLDLAAIIYTSGSTGRPRGVMLSHLNIRSNTDSIVEYLHLGLTDRVLVVLPFYYVYGLSLLHTHVAVGGAVIVENRFAFPNLALKAMQSHGATGFSGVPSTFALLLHRSAIRTTTFPALRYVTQAGGPMAPAMIREFRQAVPHVAFYVMYGATEASARLSYLEPAELDRRMGSIGRAIPNVELRLLKDDGQAASPGETGEIVARGSNIASGYWNAPEETLQAFGPEGYHTGDLARADEDGFLYIVGRKRDMLKVGAHRVGAKEIEDVLHEHPDVFEAAVIGEPHQLLGEVPVAVVSHRDGRSLDLTAVIAHCRNRLADYKVPARILVQPELPKNEAGKIDKRALRALLDTVRRPADTAD